MHRDARVRRARENGTRQKRVCVFAFSFLRGWHKRARRGPAPASRPSIGRFRPRAACTRHPARTQHGNMPASPAARVARVPSSAAACGTPCARRALSAPACPRTVSSPRTWHAPPYATAPLRRSPKRGNINTDTRTLCASASAAAPAAAPANPSSATSAASVVDTSIVSRFFQRFVRGRTNSRQAQCA